MTLKCPKCNAEQLYSAKRGFGFGKSLAGLLVAGPAGLFAGAIGKNKIETTCLNCGFKWKAGANQSSVQVQIPIKLKKLKKKQSNPELLQRKKEGRSFMKKQGCRHQIPNFQKLAEEIKGNDYTSITIAKITMMASR